MSGARVLVVDDDAALLQALPEALHLRLPELVVDTCDEALEALRRIAEVDYDAIISDIKMPGMDGLALLEQVHAIRPSTPTLLITGHGEPELLASGEGALGADVVAILLLNGAGTALRVRASIGLEQAVGEEIALGTDVIGQIAERRQPYIVDDLTEVPELIPGLRAQARSLVAAPLVVESRVIGVICCGARATGAYTHDDAQLLRLAADRIALALDHARLYQEVQEAMREQRVARLRVEELATQLGHQAAELGAIIEAMADGVFVCDPSARITRLNKAASTLLGLPVGAAAGLTVADIGEMVQLRAGDGEPLAQADIPFLCALRGESRTDLLTAITQVRTGTEVRLRISSEPLRDP